MLGRDLTMENLFDGLDRGAVLLALMQHCPPDLKGKDAEEILKNPRYLYQATNFWLNDCCNDFTHVKRILFRDLKRRSFILNRKMRK